MRYLNKIIFINSAHVPYAEIKLDGNVHFIGTQGVGKSTLLRAILFFYNVDKSKLGIKTQDKQKSFDEFYLPYPNSYIIYEVCRDDSKYFIMTFSSNNRAAFRIIDCPYDRSFFLDEENAARVEWGKISEIIGTRIFKSNIIRGCEELRDIIYGNTPSITNKDLRRFSILESTKYQNVPRTIQNIFLNQSLESRVIKDTIIDSMDFSNDSIDLIFYREQLKNFKQQYKDIWKWYKKDKYGKIKVKSDADDVILRYTMYEYTRKQIVELCGQIKYALERDNERIPQLEHEENKYSLEHSRQSRLLEEENGKYTKERDALKGEEAILKNFLDTLRKKQQHYSEINIAGIIERIGKETEIHIQHSALKSQEAQLTEQNNDIASKYAKLKGDLDNALHEYIIDAEQKQNQINADSISTKSRLQNEHNDNLQAIRDSYQLKIDGVQAELNNILDEERDNKIKKQNINHFNPYQEIMDDLQTKINNANERKHELDKAITSKQGEIDSITNTVTLKRTELERLCEKDILQIENKIQQLDIKIQELDELLSRQSGSLIEWLGENVKGWEGNIGRVLDEKSVLYNTALHPSLTEVSDSVYGVKLNLENIDRTILTPEEIKSQRTELEESKKSHINKIAQRKQQLDTDIQELERKPNAQLKALRMEKINLEAEFHQLPNKIANLQKELDSYNDKLIEWRKHELELLKNEIAIVENKRIAQDQKKKELIKKRDKELEDVIKSLHTQLRNIDDSVKSQINQINEGINTQKLQTEERKRELDKLMDDELKGLGVDVVQLQNLREQIQKLEVEMDFIKNHRSDYISWQNDKRDYFDCEHTKTEERKRIKAKIDDLQEKFESRKIKIQDEINLLSGELNRTRSLQESLRESINKTNNFLCSSSCPQEYSDVEKIETVTLLADIFESLRDNIGTQQRQLEEFRDAVTVFKNNFSAQNTFNFRIDINTTADYVEFASDLNDFVTNNKIEEYRIRTSDQYASIITQIAKEVSNLIQHNADIKQTINEINKDFRENIFAGVIREIELRPIESNDRLMQQLLNIKKFDDENAFNIGQPNLFSDEETQQHINQQAVGLLMTLIDMMEAELKRDKISLSDTFKLEFRVKENDNDTGWVEKLSNVGSNGTDSLVKSMVNIMLINVFKNKISRKFGDFKLHCMMDEIGTLHPTNVKGILDFANARNIYLINGSPTTYNAQAYKYTYSLSKDESTSNTIIKPLLTIR